MTHPDGLHHSDSKDQAISRDSAAGELAEVIQLRPSPLSPSPERPPATEQEAIAALRDGTVRIGCTRGAALADVSPAALIGIVQRVLDLERRPPGSTPLPEVWTGYDEDATLSMDAPDDDPGIAPTRARWWRRHR